MGKGTYQLMVLGIIDILIAVCGLYVWKIYGKGSIIAITAILLAFVTYFGFMAISQSQDAGWAANLGSMRTAITSAVLAIYFFILPISIYLIPENGLTEFGKTMINNFTAIIGIIIPFYFGASAYAQAHAPRKTKGDGQDDISDQLH